MAKKREHWRRDEPQFFNFLALDREPMSDAPDVVRGLPGTLLSKDIRTDDATLLVELPVGWRYEFDGKGASLELFVLQGRVSYEGRWIGPGGAEGSGEGGPGGFVRVMYLPPGEISPFEHAHHECWEELYVLQGDILIVDEGVHGLGSVNMHPQEWWHGPYVSRFASTPSGSSRRRLLSSERSIT